MVPAPAPFGGNTNLLHSGQVRIGTVALRVFHVTIAQNDTRARSTTKMIVMICATSL